MKAASWVLRAHPITRKENGTYPSLLNVSILPAHRLSQSEAQPDRLITHSPTHECRSDVRRYMLLDSGDPA